MCFAHLLEITERRNHSDIAARVTADISHRPLFEPLWRRRSRLLWLTGYCFVFFYCFFFPSAFHFRFLKSSLPKSVYVSASVLRGVAGEFCSFPHPGLDSLQRQFGALMSFLHRRARKTLLKCRSILRNCFHHSSTPSALQRSKHGGGETSSCDGNLNQEQRGKVRRAVATSSSTRRRRVKTYLNALKSVLVANGSALMSLPGPNLQFAPAPENIVPTSDPSFAMGLSLWGSSRPKEFEMTCNFLRYIHGLAAAVLKEPLVYFTWLFSNLKLLKEQITVEVLNKVFLGIDVARKGVFLKRSSLWSRSHFSLCCFVYWSKCCFKK